MVKPLLHLLLFLGFLLMIGSDAGLPQLASPRMSYPEALSGRFAPRQDLPEWMRVPRWYTRDAPRWGKGETAALVHELADHNANVFRLGMMWGGRSHYPSEVAPHSPSLQEGVDPLAEALAAAKERGVHVLTYVNPNAVYEGHPLYDEVCLRGEDGAIWDVRAYGREGTRYACVNHPAFIRLYTGVLKEIFTRYGPDGLYVDGLTPHVCYCEHCRAKFRADAGRDLPEGLTQLGPLTVLWEMTSDWDVVGNPQNPDHVLYSQWLMKCLTDATRAFTETVKGIKPSAVTVYHSWPKPDILPYYDGTLNEIYATVPWRHTLWKRAEFANWGDVFSVPSLVNIYLRQRPWGSEERRVESEVEARHMYWQTLAQGAYPNAWATLGMERPFEVMRDHAECFDLRTTFPVRFLALPRAMFHDARMRKVASQVAVPLAPGTQGRLRILEREPGGKIDLLCLRADGRRPSDDEHGARERPDDVIYLAAEGYDPTTSLNAAGEARWETHEDEAALSGAYVTSLGHGRGEPQTHLDYALPEIRRPGPWRVWARVIFPTVGSDSFHWQVSNDGGDSWLPPEPRDDCALGWEQPQEYAWVEARVALSPANPNTDRFLSPYAGMYAAVLHARLPVKQLHPNHINAQSLEGFRVLVLANEVCLSDEQCALIERFVAEGGGLLATHETSLYDMEGRRRRDFGLAELFGCSLAGSMPQAEDGQRIVLAADHAAVGGLPDSGLPNHEEHLIVKPTTAQTIARLDGPSVPDGGVPAVLVREYGRGRVVYVPGRLDSSYSYWGDPAFREFVGGAVEWLCDAQLPVRVDPESQVGVTLFEQPSRSRWLIHLVNFSAEWAAAFDALQPIENITVKVLPPGGFRAGAARAVLSGQELPVEALDRGPPTFTLPRLDEYEIVAVQWER